MNLEKIYHDMDGKERNILQMVKLYPEWAANMIQMKEGWRSPEKEITCPDCGIKHKLKDFIW
jgi:hypothetical protein